MAYTTAWQPQPQRRSSTAAVSANGPIVVTDEWPEQVPMGDAELRILEGHLREELDALFGPLP